MGSNPASPAKRGLIGNKGQEIMLNDKEEETIIRALTFYLIGLEALSSVHCPSPPVEDEKERIKEIIANFGNEEERLRKYQTQCNECGEWYYSPLAHGVSSTTNYLCCLISVFVARAHR